MLKYTHRAFLVGIPGRDLTDEEVEKYGGEDYLISTGLYKKINLEEEYADGNDRNNESKTDPAGSRVKLRDSSNLH